LIDYDEFCNGNLIPKINNNIEISVQDLKKKIDRGEKFTLIDVREPFEKSISNIGGELIPMKDLPSRAEGLNKEDEIILYCRTGHRSDYAARYLRKLGFRDVKNLLGGIHAWSDYIDSSVTKY
jgi:adenylyltransferase/sulfurtransferase